MFNMLKSTFRDMYFESAGYDVEQMRKERKEKIKREKEEINIFSKMTKNIIRILGGLYIVIALLSISINYTNKNYLGIIEYSIMLIIDLSAIITISFKNRTCEKVALILILLFIVFNFLIPII